MNICYRCGSQVGTGQRALTNNIIRVCRAYRCGSSCIFAILSRHITLPDARADFPFDDGRKTTFVNYLRVTFQWGGFPGWERSKNPPRKEIAELSQGLLPL